MSEAKPGFGLHFFIELKMQPHMTVPNAFWQAYPETSNTQATITIDKP